MSECPICQGKKLIPFVKNGKAISFAWRDCECRLDQDEKYADTLVPHWCKVHDTAFFKRGRMYSYAHPIQATGRWCSEVKDGEGREKRPEDFDFPVSWDWHRFYSERYGGGDPGAIGAPAFERSEQAATPEKAPARTSSELTQLRALITDVKGRIDLHILRSKRKKGEY